MIDNHNKEIKHSSRIGNGIVVCFFLFLFFVVV